LRAPEGRGESLDIDEGSETEYGIGRRSEDKPQV
jgi:hypothetical protein